MKKNAIIIILLIIITVLIIVIINKNNKINELNNLEKEIENKIKKELIINNLNTNNYEQIIYNNEIEEKINITNKEINENKLEEHKLILDKENIFPKIDKLVNVQEELEYAINEYNELKNNSEIVDIAKEYLEKAYKNMKENIKKLMFIKFDKIPYFCTIL